MPIALSTDLYELTMAAAYFARRRTTPRATFEVYVRELPPERGYLVAAGIEQALDFLEGFHVTADEIRYLRELPQMRGAPEEFFSECLPALRFTGDVDAVPEGTPVFAAEPILRVTAPIIEAQVVETALLAFVNFQTAIASKASRVVEASRGRPVLEFGTRRAHGLEAAMYAARAAYLAGCESTSNVEAGYRFGIPVSGTMAHSWVLTFADELEAFEAFANVYGNRAVLLIDTYDTVEAARRIVRSGLRPAAVRIDSGDLPAVGRAVRQVLDEGGLSSTRIVASGDLDEHKVAALVDGGAPYDIFGVGTAISTSRDAPALGGIYKLVAIERGGQVEPVMKLSAAKHNLPGLKQVWRQRDGSAMRDIIELEGRPGPEGAVPLLQPAIRGGVRTGASEPLTTARDRCAREVHALPAGVRRLVAPDPYPVVIGSGLEELAAHARRLAVAAQG